jgi:hypothetical protein
MENRFTLCTSSSPQAQRKRGIPESQGEMNERKQHTATASTLALQDHAHRSAGHRDQTTASIWLVSRRSFPRVLNACG